MTYSFTQQISTAISTPTASDDIANVCSVFNVNQVAILPIDSSQLRQATRKDDILSKVIVYLWEGWPNKISDELQPYY